MTDRCMINTSRCSLPQYSAAEVRQGEEKARRQAIDAEQLERDASGRQAGVDQLAATVADRKARVEVR